VVSRLDVERCALAHEILGERVTCVPSALSVIANRDPVNGAVNQRVRCCQPTGQVLSTNGSGAVNQRVRCLSTNGSGACQPTGQMLSTNGSDAVNQRAGAVNQRGRCCQPAGAGAVDQEALSGPDGPHPPLTSCTRSITRGGYRSWRSEERRPVITGTAGSKGLGRR
jgi:hypothetical protein